MISADPNKIWILCGDFNEVRFEEERKGSMFSVNGAHVFNSFIANCGLVDLHLGGRKYTWMNTEASKFSKLDRFIVSDMFLQFWPNSNTLALPRLYSDHCPIMLNTNSPDFGPLPFRFLSSWFLDEGLGDVVKDSWCVNTSGLTVFSKIERLSRKLRILNKI